jgi:hypothetical protein
MNEAVYKLNCGDKLVEVWREDHDETSYCWTIKVDGERVHWWIEEHETALDKFLNTGAE